MKTVSEQIAENSKLPLIERIAGYLAKSAQLAELGAKLRPKKEDSEWTEEEEALWESIGDSMDPWWYSMDSSERDLMAPIDLFLSFLCRGEMPDTKEIKEYIAKKWPE